MLAMEPQERLFWSAYRQWLDVASAADLDQMDHALADLAPHVRPIDQVVADALRDDETLKELPLSLVAILTLSLWNPASVLLMRALLSEDPESKPLERTQPRIA